jgi:TolB protein
MASGLGKLTGGSRALCFAVAAGTLVVATSPASAEPLIQHPVLRTYQPVTIALPDFVADGLSEAEPAHAISQTIATDLKGSGVFAPDRGTFGDTNVSFDEVPKFDTWRKARELVIGRVTRLPDARIKVQFRLWDVATGTYLMGQQYVGTPDDLNRIAHMISEEIHERVTNKRRTFD